MTDSNFQRPARALEGDPFAEATTRARALHPDFDVTAESFREFLAARLCAAPGEEPSTAALDRVNLGDLYLACACEAGDERACSEFLRVSTPLVASALRGFPELRIGLDEAKCLVFERLFLGSARGRAKIAHYEGRGELLSWVKVVAVRLLINLARDEKSGKRQDLEEDMLFEGAMAREPMDRVYLKSRYREHVKQAFAEAFASLEPKQRSILRFEVIEGMSCHKIAVIYGVHPVTASRWVKDIHQALSKKVRAILKERLNVRPAELESILNLVTSSWQLSVARLLGCEV